MEMHLVTGYAGKEHIKSADQGSYNAAFIGSGQYVMEAGNQMSASIIDNNTVRILDGDIMMKGRHIRLDSGTYKDVLIENGTSGVNRYDLIVVEYEKDAATGIESSRINVVKGAETTGTPTEPSYTDGDILGGASFNQMPLYKVLIKGVVLKEITCLFDTISTYKTLAEKYEKGFIEACDTHLESLDVLDTIEQLEANTREKKLMGALAGKEVNRKADDLQEQIEVERKRIDNLLKLEDGSTTGDAELADARIGYNGTTYETAGAAIRGQCKDLNDQITELKTYITEDLLGGAS